MPFSVVVQTTDLGPTSDETVFFRGWPYKPEVVNDNVNRYNAAVDGNVDYQTVTHGDYERMLDLYSAAPYPHVWKMVWAEEFNSFLRIRLGEFLINDESVED